MKQTLPVYIAGVDEVGRGPLAGPVFAAAVILKPRSRIKGLTDSKLLTAQQRESLSKKIMKHALAWAIGRAEVEEIDRINIFHASLLAMQRAVLALAIQPQEVLIDGKHCPQIPYACRAIVKGDLLIPAISAASIIAKVYRDAEMCLLDEQYPGYAFAQHKGYSTQEHIQKLAELGPCAIHRRSFMRVAQYELELSHA